MRQARKQIPSSPRPNRGVISFAVADQNQRPCIGRDESPKSKFEERSLHYPLGLGDIVHAKFVRETIEQAVPPPVDAKPPDKSRPEQMAECSARRFLLA